MPPLGVTPGSLIAPLQAIAPSAVAAPKSSTMCDRPTWTLRSLPMLTVCRRGRRFLTEQNARPRKCGRHSSARGSTAPPEELMSVFSRRTMLRGAGVALALPWLESLAPRTARGQAAATARRKRYISMFYPHGGVPYYWPAATGAGDDWQLSSVMEPLAPVKAKLAVLGGVGNYSPWGGHVEPSHGNVCAATWTCVKANGEGSANSGTSVDQVIAKTIGGATPLSSLQVGLSTDVPLFALP